MIRVGDEARRAILHLLSEAGALTGGVRLTVAAEAGETTCELEVADRPEVGDMVLEVGGVRLFLDARAADALDDAELVVERGEIAVALRAAAGCGDT